MRIVKRTEMVMLLRKIKCFTREVNLKTSDEYISQKTDEYCYIHTTYSKWKVSKS